MMLALIASLLLVSVYAAPKQRYEGLSISGISSGGSMAVQMQVAYSSSFMGAAIFAGTPFFCAQANVLIALGTCCEPGRPSLISTSLLNTYIESWAEFGTVDNPTNLADHRVFLFSGTNDTIVAPGIVKLLEKQYVELGVQQSNILTDYTLQASHTFPTLNYGDPCLVTASPYLGNCKYDGAGNALKQIYGNLIQPPNKKNNFILSNVKNMSLYQFLPTGIFSAAELSMDDTFFYYLPTKCQHMNCSVHIALHGCKQAYSIVGDAFINHAGYNSWAEANNIIILYPQTIASYIIPFNPQACWDWWGYTLVDYATILGPQMSTLFRMSQYFVNGEMFD